MIRMLVLILEKKLSILLMAFRIKPPEFDHISTFSSVLHINTFYLFDDGGDGVLLHFRFWSLYLETILFQMIQTFMQMGSTARLLQDQTWEEKVAIFVKLH